MWRRSVLISAVLHTAAFAGLWSVGDVTLSTASPDTVVPGDMSVLVLCDALATRIDPRPATPSATAPLAVPNLLPPPVVEAAQPLQPADVGPVERPVSTPPQTSIQPVQHRRPANGATTEFFGVPVQAQSIVFVIDRSASMGLQQRWELAQQELAKSLTMLPAECRFQLLVYNRHSETLQPPGLRMPTPNHVIAATRLMESLKPEGGNDHRTALKAALYMEPDAIYWLTDADDISMTDVRDVSKFNHGRSCIHVVLLGTPKSTRDEPLQEMARINRGVYREVR